MTGSGLLGIARSALLAHQTVLQTISHNIANAETPGYSRQDAVLRPNTPAVMSYGSAGGGVSVATIVRNRNIMLDDTYRATSGSTGFTELRRDLLQQLEGVFGEPTDAGMSVGIDQFFNAWSDLAANPGDNAAKAVVQQRGNQLATLFNMYDRQLSTLRTSTIGRLTNTVSEINVLANQVADYNYLIVSAEVGGHAAGDLRDQRDLILDRLSRVAGASIIPQNNGSVSVIMGNSTLVDGSSARPLIAEMVPPGTGPAGFDDPMRVRLGNSPDALTPLGGELRALVQFLGSDIPNVRGRLDAMANAIVTSVNSEHVQNFVFNGSTIPGTQAGNFFDPGSSSLPVRAGSLRLSDTVAADSNAIGTSRNASAPQDNTGAYALSALRDRLDTVVFTTMSGSVETGTLADFFRTIVTRLGFDVKSAQDDAQVQSTLAEQADRRRQATFGVNTDEELVHMLRVQQAYVAATKLIKSADEMLQTLLSIV